MRKYEMIAMATIFMLSTALVAQPQPKRMNDGVNKFRQGEKQMITPEKRAETLAKKLELSDVEKVEVQALFEEQEAKNKQRMEEIQKMREERKARFEAEKIAQEADLIKIIGNEKFQKLQSMRIAHLEKENRMHKMRAMSQRVRDNDQRNPKMEKMRKMRMERMRKERVVEE